MKNIVTCTRELAKQGNYFRVLVGKHINRPYIENRKNKSENKCRLHYGSGHAAGVAVVETLPYKPEGRGISSRLCHCNFLLT
jgi:hypothetical protein